MASYWFWILLLGMGIHGHTSFSAYKARLPGPKSPIADGKKLQIWSLMSTSHDQYVCMADINGSSIAVKANGSADGKSSIIVTFKYAIEIGVIQWYNISFETDAGTFYLSATGSGEIVAVQKSNGYSDNELWLLQYMLAPNEPFFVMQSYLIRVTKDGHKELFLSSDGEGNLMLKPSNSNSPLPSGMGYYTDPALLFRLVGPPL